MSEDRQFFRVAHSHYGLRTSDHLEHGYEEQGDYRRALRMLVERWHDRIGEAVDARHEFRLLRFHDTPGGVPDEAWLPLLMLEPVPPPGYMARQEHDSSDDVSDELDEAFGFD